MAIAQTQKYEEFVLEVEFTAGSGTFSRSCGLTDLTVSRSNNTETTLVPDCADESLPHHTVREVQSQDTTISGTGVWSLASHADMQRWFRTGVTLNVRLTNAKVTADGASGDPEIETIPMILSALNNSREKGVSVTAEIELQQNGAVIVTDKA